MIAVNDAFRRVRADLIYAADGDWWEAYARLHRWPVDGREYLGAAEVGAECWTATASAAEAFGLKLARIENGNGLSLVPGVLRHGGNGGHQAVNLAVEKGARRVLLLGFDMKAAPDGRRHWFGDHPGRMNKASPYGQWARNFEAMPPALERLGVAVINCSRETAIRAFPRVPLERALADSIGPPSLAAS